MGETFPRWKYTSILDQHRCRGTRTASKQHNKEVDEELIRHLTADDIAIIVEEEDTPFTHLFIFSTPKGPKGITEGSGVTRSIQLLKT